MQALHELGVLDPKVPSVTSTVFVTDTALLVTLAHKWTAAVTKAATVMITCAVCEAKSGKVCLSTSSILCRALHSEQHVRSVAIANMSALLV